MSDENKPTQQENEYNDSKTNLLKFDMPIGKLRFFVNSIILFIIQMIVVALYYLCYFITKSPESFIILFGIFSLIFGIPLLYLNFVNTVKRMWDITGTFHKGLWFSVGLFVTSFICVFLFPIAILFFYFAMILMPGIIIKNK